MSVSVLTALVSALIAVVATPFAPPMPGASERMELLDNPGPLPPAADETVCGPLRETNPDGNYIVPGVRGAIVYRRIGSGPGATECM